MMEKKEDLADDEAAPPKNRISETTSHNNTREIVCSRSRFGNGILSHGRNTTTMVTQNQQERRKLAPIPENREKKFGGDKDSEEGSKKNNNDNNTTGNGGGEDTASGNDHDESLTTTSTTMTTTDGSVLWSGANAGWTLTWPIWHLLPHDERHSLAKQYGYKSIGEFEEYMSLQQAMGDSILPTSTSVSAPESASISSPKKNSSSSSSSSSSVQKPYKNEDAYPHLNEMKKLSLAANEQQEEEDDDDDDENSSSDEIDSDQNKNSNTVDETGLTVEELMALGGKILVLPSELLHRVFTFLPVDTYGVLALVSPHWKHLTRTERVYKRLCERLYLNQSKRRQLHVNRFGGSYRRMLEIRPRVRPAGGCYVIKYAHIKKIQRDMWTEVPIGAILETIYYRYLYFQEDGRVLYALTSSPPHEMFRRLKKLVLQKDAKDTAAVWGTFFVQGPKCTVTAKQEHTTVQFVLTIQPQSSFGRFAALTMDEHYSSASGKFEDWSEDRVEYKVPTEVFRFIRDSRL